ncbi:small nuclear ribonucleoprotein E2 (nucleomorph) [Lotharella oceanica]|uniref:Small nuclear ribonucleoprotein E2 n=1 Tax=Lotharella oceanica TaxID=641309 RepID=A0A060DAA9_9EUKA|nr:small nuclear ribonucleoprotein E2 [Lotharella oceanica]
MIIDKVMFIMYMAVIKNKKIIVISEKKSIFIGHLIGFDEYMNLVLYDGKFKDTNLKKYISFDYIIITDEIIKIHVMSKNSSKKIMYF